MVYESDFYTTRRPYSRPTISSYSITVPGYYHDEVIPPYLQYYRHHAIPYLAHARLTTTGPPPRTIRVRPSVLVAEIDRIAHRARPCISYQPTEDYLNSRSIVSFDDETRSIRAHTNALLKRIHDPLPPRIRKPLLSATPNFDIDPPMRITSDAYIQRMLGPVRTVQNEVDTISYYPEPAKQFIGKGHLACISYAGGRPISKRRNLAWRDDDDRRIKDEVNFLSHYGRMRSAARGSNIPDGYTSEAPGGLYYLSHSLNRYSARNTGFPSEYIPSKSVVDEKHFDSRVARAEIRLERARAKDAAATSAASGTSDVDRSKRMKDREEEAEKRRLAEEEERAKRMEERRKEAEKKEMDRLKEEQEKRKKEMEAEEERKRKEKEVEEERKRKEAEEERKRKEKEAEEKRKEKEAEEERKRKEEEERKVREEEERKRKEEEERKRKEEEERLEQERLEQERLEQERLEQERLAAEAAAAEAAAAEAAAAEAAAAEAAAAEAAAAEAAAAEAAAAEAAAAEAAAAEAAAAESAVTAEAETEEAPQQEEEKAEEAREAEADPVVEEPTSPEVVPTNGEVDGGPTIEEVVDTPVEEDDPTARKLAQLSQEAAAPEEEEVNNIWE